MQTWFGWLGQGGQTYLWVAIGLAAFALLVSPKRWIALGLAGLSTAALAGFLVLQVPTFGKDNIVGLEVGQEPLIMEVWSMLSAPLTTELQTVFWWALSVTVVGAVGAVAVALLRNRKAIPSSV